MTKLYIVGIGPGSKDYLTEAAIKTVQKSDVVMGSKRALDLFETDKPQIGLNSKDMAGSFKNAIWRVKSGQMVSLLSTGDPGFSGVLKPILDLNDDIEVEVIPGISSVQLCAAKLKIPWDQTDLVTMHGKGITEDIMDLMDNEKPTIILPDFKTAELAKFLIKNGVSEDRKAAVCEKLSYDDEKIVETSLKNISDMEFSYMSVLVIY